MSRSWSLFQFGWLGFLTLGLSPLNLLAEQVPKGEGESKDATEPPNIVLVFTDDLGYGDVGCFGAKGYATPNIDRLAREGIRFTNFYVPQAVCSASRAAVLTGCYPNRVGILGALGPAAKHGIADEESTVAEVLKRRGYATAAYGKWHLGHHPQFLPTRHGFDDYLGLPYSNDMWRKHPTNRSFPDLPLIEKEKVVETNPDQSKLTTWYAERSVRFIKENKDRPFFLYLAHSMPHVPLHVSDKFAGRTDRGLFGDVIEEIDWSVGQILKTLEENGLDRKTLVVFTSDNGPWLSYGDHAGSAGPFREGKGTSFEGGVREPFVARWPGKIPSGSVCDEPAMTIDLLPTFASIAKADRSGDRPIDGLDITPLLTAQPGAKSPRKAFYFYWGKELQAVRSGPWKLHFPHTYRSLKGKPGSGGTPSEYKQPKIELSLYNLENDPAEKINLVKDRPEVVQELERLADQAREDLGDSASKKPGRNVRGPGQLREGGS